MLGNTMWKMLGDVGKARRKEILKNEGTKKNLMNAKDVNVLIIQNWISCSGINGSGNDFMENL